MKVDLEREVVEGCTGSVVSVVAWCPDCDCNTKHIWISKDCRECQTCNELSHGDSDDGS